MIDELGVTIVASDGIELSVRIYRPEGPGPHPTLFAASPYRYDNDDVPETTMYLWHEVGPIRWYVERGYAYVHLDVRGTGRSGGRYEFFGPRERRDLYEVIEWIAEQSWSNGRVGGIGQSYYGVSQWCMAAERPPHLACIAPFDGHIDLYRGWFYAGGIQSNFIQTWWNDAVRMINRSPANGVDPRFIDYDLLGDLVRRPLIDDYWSERALDRLLGDVDIPVYSVGIWSKRDIHLGGNIRGFQLVRGPSKLHLSGAPTMTHAVAQFASVEFHGRVLAPFYDHYLRDADTDYLARPPVEYHVTGAGRVDAAKTWPPAGTAPVTLLLDGSPSGSVRSLNDGSLLPAPRGGGGATPIAYPDEHWAIGNVAIGPAGPDPVLRNVTFTSAPLDAAMLVTGAPVLTLFLSSTRKDANVIVKLTEQFPLAEGAAADAQPRFHTVSKGWLRASHRALDEAGALPGEIRHDHRVPETLQPGCVYRLSIALTHMAHQFSAGSRIRLELSPADLPVTEAVFSHVFSPDMIGTDTYHHDVAAPSSLTLPVLGGGG